MRIYYVMEAQGRRCHVLSALGVDARAWNRLHRRVLRMAAGTGTLLRHPLRRRAAPS